MEEVKEPQKASTANETSTETWKIAYSTAYSNIVSIYDSKNPENSSFFQGPQIGESNIGKND